MVGRYVLGRWKSYRGIYIPVVYNYNHLLLPALAGISRQLSSQVEASLLISYSDCQLHDCILQ